MAHGLHAITLTATRNFVRMPGPIIFSCVIHVFAVCWCLRKICSHIHDGQTKLGHLLTNVLPAEIAWLFSSRPHNFMIEFIHKFMWILVMNGQFVCQPISCLSRHERAATHHKYTAIAHTMSKHAKTVNSMLMMLMIYFDDVHPIYCWLLRCDSLATQNI